VIKPESQTLPNDIYRVTQEGTGKESIDSALETLREELGKPAGFIHLHPSKTGNAIFSENESELVKQVFLIAGSLKVDLTRVDPDTRRIFMAVTRTDGNLGLSSNISFQEGSGLSGLVKSLHWEWPDVFCRLVDLNQEIEIKKASKLIIQEIHDPARELLEVGLSGSARSTLVRENN
jgi:hypothetical protein